MAKKSIGSFRMVSRIRTQLRVGRPVLRYIFLFAFLFSIDSFKQNNSMLCQCKEQSSRKRSDERGQRANDCRNACKWFNWASLSIYVIHVSSLISTVLWLPHCRKILLYCNILSGIDDLLTFISRPIIALLSIFNVHRPQENLSHPIKRIWNCPSP